MAKASWNNYQTNAFVQDTEALPDCSSVYQRGSKCLGKTMKLDGWCVLRPPLSVLEEMRMVRFGELLRDWGFYIEAQCKRL